MTDEPQEREHQRPDEQEQERDLELTDEKADQVRGGLDPSQKKG